MKVLQEYSVPQGDAWLLQGDVYYVVVCRTNMSPGVVRIKQWGRLSHEAALERYARVRATLLGQPYVRPHCRYSPSRIKVCRSKNCPAKLGGAAYWEIFATSCLFKVR
ncbi:MAG: hypothetical protein K2L94_03260 [Alphaproteobacteria bacterium]|nr:hypothetical protein [Alphaproteobacteria bacterium]